MSVERDLIGLCLKNRDGFEKALAAGVQEDSFLDPVCSTIFAAMREDDQRGKSIGIATAYGLGPSVANEVGEIMRSSPTTLNVKHFADEVAAAAWVRRAHASVRTVSEAIIGRKDHEPTGKIRELALEAMDRIAEGPRNSGGPRLARDVLPEWVEDVESRVMGKKSSNVTTGFKALDLVFNGGWHRGAFCVVAARPGRGKTTFGLSAAINAAAAGHTTLFATVEMTARDIVTKVVSNLARVKSGAYIRGDLTEDETDRTMSQVERISGLPLWIDDAWQGSFDRFAAHCRRLKRRGGLDLVFLDYIGLAKLGGDHDSRREEVVAISTACKMMALELDIAVVALAQLNRQAEDAQVPGKEHIAESDNLGRDPDGVILIYRTEADGMQEEQTRLHVAKNRWGLETDLPIQADLAYSAFRSTELNWESFKS